METPKLIQRSVGTILPLPLLVVADSVGSGSHQPLVVWRPHTNEVSGPGPGPGPSAVAALSGSNDPIDGDIELCLRIGKPKM